MGGRKKILIIGKSKKSKRSAEEVVTKVGI